MFKIIFVLGLAFNSFADTISVAICANISYVINPLIKEFNRLNPNIKVQISQASSGKLFAQILHNAPYQLFLSADMTYPQKLYQNGFATNTPKIYAKGKLVLFSAKQRKFNNIKTILDSSIDTIAIANPKIAPYGKATKEALLNAKIYKDIYPKLTYAQSISQTLLLSLKACDIGFVSKSALFIPSMQKYKQYLNWIDIDTSLYTPISQGMVILKNAKDNQSVRKFYNFLQTKKAQNIFKRYGYTI